MSLPVGQPSLGLWFVVQEQNVQAMPSSSVSQGGVKKWLLTPCSPGETPDGAAVLSKKSSAKVRSAMIHRLGSLLVEPGNHSSA